eukprot:3300743-Rhodomonas_salina.1
MRSTCAQRWVWSERCNAGASTIFSRAPICTLIASACSKSEDEAAVWQEDSSLLRNDCSVPAALQSLPQEKSARDFSRRFASPNPPPAALNENSSFLTRPSAKFVVASRKILNVIPSSLIQLSSHFADDMGMSPLDGGDTLEQRVKCAKRSHDQIPNCSPTFCGRVGMRSPPSFFFDLS